MERSAQRDDSGPMTSHGNAGAAVDDVPSTHDNGASADIPLTSSSYAGNDDNGSDTPPNSSGKSAVTRYT